MLSRIENGAALPSLGTINYLAMRLNVSPGYLIADADDEQIYYKYNEINDIKKAYIAEDYRICHAMCKSSKSIDDDEIRLILSECSLAIGIEEFNSGNLKNACVYFDEAIENCSSTIYHTGYIVAVAGVYFKYMKALSSTLEPSVLDTDKANLYASFSNDFCIYAMLLDNYDLSTIIPSLCTLHEESPYSMHLLAKKKMNDNNFEEGYKILHDILYGEKKVPQPVIYSIICDLEKCCKELNDYKGAYEYSNEKLSMLQKMLS